MSLINAKAMTYYAVDFNCPIVINLSQYSIKNVIYTTLFNLSDTMRVQSQNSRNHVSILT